jgi:hypothetical protein
LALVRVVAQVENTDATVGERLDLFGPRGSLLSVATAVAENSHRSWVRPFEGERDTERDRERKRSKI